MQTVGLVFAAASQVCRPCDRSWEPNGDQGGMISAPRRTVAGRDRGGDGLSYKIVLPGTWKHTDDSVYSPMVSDVLLGWAPQKREDAWSQSLPMGPKGGLLEQSEMIAKHYLLLPPPHPHPTSCQIREKP